MNRRTIRLLASALAGAMAIIYFLIGAGVLDVGSAEGADHGFIVVFGAVAGGAFLLGAILLAFFDKRWLWVLGALFQAFVIWAYIDVSSTRTPPFEAWGITLRIIQLPLVAALAYLALSPPREDVQPAERRWR